MPASSGVPQTLRIEACYSKVNRLNRSSGVPGHASLHGTVGIPVCSVCSVSWGLPGKGELAGHPTPYEKPTSPH